MHYINKTRLFILTVTITLIFSFMITYAKYINNNLAQSLVRLHILANSNSETDQQLKIKVRNRILQEASHLFESSMSAGDALLCAKQNSGYLAEIAKDEICRNGFEYDVKVTVGKYPFPTKTYNDIMLPAGSYNAVRIEIGKAHGKNWWCVMYPPLCFTNETLSLTNNSRNILKSSLSTDSYNLITGKKSGAVPVRFRFKIVELFQRFFD